MRINKSKRLLELDVFRGIAALSVVLYHYTTRYDKLYGHSKELSVYFPDGDYGVCLFFMISGFVILMTLERTQRSLDFIVGRFSRLYPTYWTAVILTFTVTSIAKLRGRGVYLGEALINLTMFQEFLNVRDVDGVYWTLSLELSFYIIMFIFYQTRLLKHLDLIAVGWLLLMLLTAGLENYVHVSIPSNIRTFLILEYIHLFIIGIMLYQLHKQGFSVGRWMIIGACLLAEKLYNSWESVLILAALVLLFYLALKGYLKFLNWQPLLFLGSISYALYLIHQNIGYVVIKLLYKHDIDGNITVLVALSLSIFLASLITFKIEQPMLRFIRGKYTKFLNVPSH